MSKHIVWGCLHQPTVGHTAQGFWRHPANRAREYATLPYWIDVARVLEDGGFDFLFLADALGALDVYGDSPDTALARAVEIPLADPLPIVSALIATTTRLNFALTVSTTYELPYALARRFTTLDNLSGGRVGFNVVTSALTSAAINLGLPAQIPHDERYDIADEFLEVTYKLWEDSWEDDAVQRDAETGRYTDPARVHAIDHHGRYFDVPGIALAEPSPQRTPVIFQAGTSPRGRAFAATHAEAIFIAVDRPEVAQGLVSDIRDRAEAAGRGRDDIRALALATVIVGETEEEALAKLAEYRSFFDYEGALTQLSALFGVDLGAADPDAPLEYVETENIRGVLEIYTKLDPSRVWTVREVAEFSGISAGGPLIVGDPVQVADELERWIDVAGVDGFNLADPVSPVTIEDFVRLAVPELRRRGLFTPAPGTTFRGALRGDGEPRVRDSHPAARGRVERVG